MDFIAVGLAFLCVMLQRLRDLDPAQLPRRVNARKAGPLALVIFENFRQSYLVALRQCQRDVGPCRCFHALCETFPHPLPGCLKPFFPQHPGQNQFVRCPVQRRFRGGGVSIA